MAISHKDGSAGKIYATSAGEGHIVHPPYALYRGYIPEAGIFGIIMGMGHKMYPPCPRFNVARVLLGSHFKAFHIDFSITITMAPQIRIRHGKLHTRLTL